MEREGSLLERIRSDLKAAMKSGNKTAVSALRMLLSSARYASIHEKRELRDDEITGLVQKAIRSRRESVEAFQKGDRIERARQEEAEIAVLEPYLPPQMGPEELERAVDELLAETGITQKKDLGRAMKEFLARHRGRVDGRSVNAVLSGRLK